MNSYAAKICNLAELLRRGGGSNNKKDHAAGKIARCPLPFLLLDPPPPFVVVLRRVSLVRLSYGTRKVSKGKLGKS